VTDRRTFLGALAGGLLAAPLAVEAQQAAKVYRIGFITTELIGQPPGRGPLWDRMRELGWVYGQNVIVGRRASFGQNERVPELASDLMRAGVDVFVVVSADAAEHVQRVTRTIPIVTIAAGDLVAAGLASSLSRPGGDVTGVQSFQVDLAGKQLALLKEMLPSLSRVGLFVRWSSSEAALRSGGSIYVGMLRQLEATAPRVGVDLRLVIVRGPVDFDAAFASLSRARVGAVIVFGSELIAIHRRSVAELLARYRMPAIYQAGAYVTEGWLMSYGPDFREHLRLAADTLDKILRGAKAGDVPIQQPTKFELAINFKTARALGLTIPPSLLARADEVIQ